MVGAWRDLCECIGRVNETEDLSLELFPDEVSEDRDE